MESMGEEGVVRMSQRPTIEYKDAVKITDSQLGGVGKTAC